MYRRCDIKCRKQSICSLRQKFYSRFEKSLKERPHNTEGQPEDKSHYHYERRNSGPLSGKERIHLPAPCVFFALHGLYDSPVTKFSDKGKSHISHRCRSIETALFFHTGDNAFKCFPVATVKAECLCDERVALYDLTGGKSYGNTGTFRMVFDHAHYCMDRAVYSSAVIVLVAEIPAPGLLIILSNVNSVSYKLIDTLVLGC